MKTCPQCSTGYPDSHTTCPTHGVLLNEIRDLKPGLVIHQSYCITRKLGQGGMGAVYLAQHILMDEPRALKFLSPELSRDQAFTARFLREVRVLRQIRNHNVVDCGDLEAAEDGSLFFSMEFVDGPNLRAFLHDPSQYQQNDCHPERSAAESGSPATGLRRWGGESKDLLLPLGSLPVPLALSITRQIAEGLGAAHAKGMVHRDIKPENILLKCDAAAWLPKIADFGIVATKESSTAYTRTGGTLLTMAYAAPEQWRGTPAASLDGRTDLYALGGLLYEMLTGQTPFQAENYEGWSHQHQTTPPQPPSTLRPDLANWQGLDALTLRLLAKDRNDRPKDVAEVLGLLDAVRLVSLNDAHRETVAERQKSKATELLRGKIFRRMLRWLWIPSVSVMTLAIVIVVLALSLPTLMISKRADELDKAHHYNLGGILRNLACMRGNGEACFFLGVVFIHGFGVTEDDSRAAALYSKACDAGYSDGCANLGSMYENGDGVAKDASRAAALYARELTLLSKSCDAGDGSKCGELGWMYEYGPKIAQDHARTAESYTKGCEAGNAKSCRSLSFLYSRGDGVQQDWSESVALDVKACNLGDKDGCFTAALAYEFGKVIDMNTTRARELWEKYCNMGEEYGCAEAAKLQ
jgi:serine/threonine protein kinase